MGASPLRTGLCRYRNPVSAVQKRIVWPVAVGAVAAGLAATSAPRWTQASRWGATALSASLAIALGLVALG
jgi:hypothetical protein